MSGHDTEESPTRVSAPGVPSPDPTLPDAGPTGKPRAIPQRFDDRYELLGELGRGGMGMIQTYLDQQLGRRIALKTLHPQLQLDATAPMGEPMESSFVDRFIDEARLQAQLEHPSVVPVYELGVDPQQRIYFTMKRVRGITLRAVLEQLARSDRDTVARWTRRRRLNAFTQVCLAVQFAHEHGVLHRDLKPANVMLGEHGEVYVLDWGIASRLVPLDGARPRRDRAGTPGYMPPEQARGDVLGPTADVHALGVMLRELLTLERPDEEPSPLAPDAMPPELAAICERATNTAPRERHPSVQAMLDELERFLEGERDSERRATMAERHAAAAEAAVERAAGDDPGSPAALRARREAMAEIGRALALQPEHPAAMASLLRLLSHPPTRLPPEAAEALEQRRAATRAWAGGVASWAYGSVLGYWPLLWWAGVREPVPLCILSVLAVLSSLLARRVAKHPRPGPNDIVPTMVVSSLLMGSTAAIFGPLVLTPTLVAVNAAPYALILRGWHRWLTALVGALVIVAPLLLMTVGAWPVTYALGPEGMLVRPYGLELSGHGAITLLIVSSIAAVLTAMVSVAKVRHDLDQAQRALELYGWHFRQLLPSSRSSG
ncbi:serine/threonine-protein kinase [Paraliomyxa miuraensis]|uniref:serine/threonine-protein kinase n=1 Tax=Paraliomyxa miuraensis TaxID=376150 RepID=UPI00225821BF|nr:protein kinase [Paraliomyxa miuraensis]MCX4243380.1 protein kinase [Paraliomyxa miuraensis]